MSDTISLCQKLVQFKSDENNNSEALAFLASYLRNLGFRTRILKYTNADGNEVENLHAEIGEGKKNLLYVGHMDVVPAGDIKAWTYPPFAAVIKDGVLYGRGIADMKGGTACFASACKEFLADNKFDGSITFIISGDEEEPLVNGTLKMLEQLTAEGKKYDFCLVGEPSNPNNIGDEIKVGRRGDVVLRITSHGKQGHTAYPHLAVNPIHNLVALLDKMQKDKLDNGNEFFEPSTMQITTFDVGNKASNVVPAKAFAQIDIRFNSNHTSKSIIEWAKKHIAESEGEFELETEIVGESFLSKIDDNIEILKEAIEQETGLVPAFSTGGGTSDARFIKDYCPVVEFGLTNKSIHKVNEAETIENIEKLQQIFKKFLGRYFA